MTICMLVVTACVAAMLGAAIRTVVGLPPSGGCVQWRSSVSSIGIVGNGILGGTHAAFARAAGIAVQTYDSVAERSSVPRIDSLVDADLVLVCVNTPPGKDGRTCDTSAVESVCAALDTAAGRVGRRVSVLIKSTVIPGTLRQLIVACPNLLLAFSPERLRERCPEEDFRREGFVILSGDSQTMDKAEVLYRQLLPGVVFRRTDPETAALVKYALNGFIAVCVSYANSLYDACMATGVDYAEFVELLRLDPRLAACPLSVPGPGGAPDAPKKRGWGGTCIPKDTAALSHWAEQAGVRTLAQMLAVAWYVNLAVREDDGWNCIAAARRTRDADSASDVSRSGSAMDTP